MEYILNSLDGGILKIEFNRPQKRNALTLDMYAQFAELLDRAQAKPEIRARFQYPFINLAMVPEFGTGFSLPDQVGYLRAAIILLGHPFDASSALSLGLVTKVLPDAEVLATAEKVAQELAQKPRAALKAPKELLRRQVRPRVEQATQDEMMEYSERERSADAREAFMAFFEKRPPRFNSSETAPQSEVLSSTVKM